MSNNANDGCVAPVALSSRVEDTLQVVDTGAAGGTRLVNIEIGREVLSWSVAEYKTRYAHNLDARRFCAMFSDGANSFVFDRRKVRWDTDIGAWARRWTIFAEMVPCHTEGRLQD